MNGERLTAGGAIFSAFAASICCIGPLLFAALGVGVFGAASFFESARPYLLSGAGLLLAISFYRAYSRRDKACAPGEKCSAEPIDRTSRAVLWLSLIAVLAFALWPYYAESLFQKTDAAASADAEKKTEHAMFKVNGMTCGGCELTIKLALEDVAGVKSAEVSYDRSEAVVEYDPKATTREKLRDAVNETGYAAEILK